MVGEQLRPGRYWCHALGEDWEIVRIYHNGKVLKVVYQDGSCDRVSCMQSTERRTLVGPIPNPDDPRWRKLVAE